nr:MAG TPA: PaRep2a protein [Caudoviricetes sp.]
MKSSVLVRILAVIIVIVVLPVTIVRNIAVCKIGQKTTAEYVLEDMGDGVYIRTGQIISTRRALNCDIAAIRIDDTLETAIGQVIIHISDNERRVIWTKSKMCFNDVLEVYVPRDGIEYGSLTQTWQ